MPKNLSHAYNALFSLGIWHPMASLGLILNVGSFRGAVPSPMLVAILAQRRSFLRFQVPCRLNPSTLPVACAAELRDMDRRDWDAGFVHQIYYAWAA